MHFRCGSYFGFLGMRRPVAQAAEAGVSDPAQGSAAVTPADEAAVSAAPPVLTKKKVKRKKSKKGSRKLGRPRQLPMTAPGEASASL